LTQTKDGSAASETAQYIEGMAKELRILAAREDLGFLAYLLSMVEQEARRTTKSDDVLERRSGL
jgi:hypothetical protein